MLFTLILDLDSVALFLSTPMTFVMGVRLSYFPSLLNGNIDSEEKRNHKTA